MTRGAKIGCMVGILPALMIVWIGLAFLGIEWMLSIPIHLAFGWIAHLSKVLPNVTVGWSGVGFFAACVVLAAFVGHRFCGWLWQGSGRREPWQLRWTLSGFGILLLMFGAGMTLTAVAHQTGWLLHSPAPLVTSGMEARNAATSLKTIATAQADFRANDRDGNGVNDFWRADIAGLYVVKGPDGNPLKLIELSIAAADDRPVTDLKPYAVQAPKAGYWFRALRYKDEKEKPDASSRFAACAFPRQGNPGTFMFLVNEENTVYRRPWEGAPPDVCPDEPLKEGWSKLD